MRKILFYILLLPFIFSCKKDEIKDEERPDYRLSEALTKYNDLLSGSANGWKGHLFPAGGGGYGFLFNFNGKNRVQMLADLDENSGSNFFESSYRLKSTTLPSLYFDTYSYLHLLADPDPQTNGGQPGWGLHSDFEFSILEAGTDTIKLKGNLNGSTLVLVKANANEAKAYKEGHLNELKQLVVDYLSKNAFNYLETSKNKTVGFNLNLNSKELVLSYDSSGVLKTKNTGFAFSGINDLILPKKITVDDLSFDKMEISDDKSSILVINGNQKIPVQVSNEPLFSFNQMLGVQFKSVVLPFEEEVAGSGAEYNGIRELVLTNARNALSAGSKLPELRLSFNKVEKTLLVDLRIIQGPQAFQTLYAFYYTEKGDSFSFEYDGPLNGNATYLEQVFRPFIDALTKGTFKFDYVIGRPQLMGSGTSSTKPDFKFIGYLQ